IIVHTSGNKGYLDSLLWSFGGSPDHVFAQRGFELYK
ncbi:unnamed protein product, partial [Rotaria sp. Silwood1]